MESLKAYPYWPDPEDPVITKGKKEEVKNIREETDFAVCGSSSFSSMPFNYYAFLTGMDRWLMDMKLNPKFYFGLCDKLLELGTRMQIRWLQEVGEYLDFVSLYDDVGTQQGLMMSHDDYRKFIHPYTKRIIETIKKHTDAKIYRHACGSCYDTIEDFIEVGIDVYHPVDALPPVTQTRQRGEYPPVLFQRYPYRFPYRIPTKPLHIHTHNASQDSCTSTLVVILKDG